MNLFQNSPRGLLPGIRRAGPAALSLTLGLAFALPAEAQHQRPDHVNNAENAYFPPVFNQDGGSCGSASRIGYMFTYEINAFRGADASKPENIYPTHFTWLLTNSHSGKEGMAMANGVPNSIVYGGPTYSRLFGNQDCADSDFGWMQGYDKWYSAMFNRISRNSFSPYALDTEKGREFVKNWLWNHQGDPDFKAGGICGIGVASACKPAPIADDPQGINAAIGVVGQKYVTRWGDGVDHALTIVGYDDRIVFDLDDNGKFGEPDKDERGAWIIVNSWGNGWANRGFIYCPYKYSFPVRQHEGGAWKPEFYHVRKNYRPLRTLKVRMDYSRRSELKLSVGISADIHATEPDVVIDLEHFKYAGDGRSERTKRGLEARTPMLGKWADGKLHDEPMEFGYDLTDLTLGFDRSRPLKYFFIVQTSRHAIGTGRLTSCSLLDYEFDRQGIETPFDTIGRGLRLQSHGARTVLTAVVQGEPLFAPANLRLAGGALQWSAPQPTHYERRGYVLYRDGQPVDTLPARLEQYSGKLSDGAAYAVAALYAVGDTLQTSALCAAVRPQASAAAGALRLDSCGFVIPGVFAARLDHATIEYWLRPRTWRNWNQSVGPGWGRFLMHANDDGSVTAGWDTRSRMDTRPGLIRTGQWTHLAVTVARDTMTLYVNGQPVDTLRGRRHNGLGGFGDLPFGNSPEGAMDGELAEVRVWKTARTPEEIRGAMHHGYAAAGLPPTLLAYYPGGLERTDSVLCLADAAGGRPAPVAAFGQAAAAQDAPALSMPTDVTVDFDVPAGPLYAGSEYGFTALCSPSVATAEWTVAYGAKDSGDGATSSFYGTKPRIIFPKPGRYEVKLTGRTADGHTADHTATVDVAERTLDARFRFSQPEGAAGERISFLPLSPVPGLRYEWTFKGADSTGAGTMNAAATYAQAGDYRVRLRVTDPETGRSRRQTQRLHVHNVAPQPAFVLSQMVVQRGGRVTLTDRSRYQPTSWQWSVDSRRMAYRAEGRSAELDMTAPGVYDVTLTAANEEGSATLTQKAALTVCNADSKNGLNFGTPAAAVTTEGNPLAGPAQAMTLEWWMNARPADRLAGMGDAAATWLLTAERNGRMRFWADSASAASPAGFVQFGQWHHYAVSFDRGEVTFWRDGEPLQKHTLKRHGKAVRTLPDVPALRLGGERAPMNAVIDEVRLWRKALADTTLQRYANAPVADVAAAQTADSLCLYYDFNQNGGDVRDALPQGHTGRRTGFGPDGDAWGLSSGVFSLNFDTPLEDLTAQYLPPATRPFATTGQTVNTKDAKRFEAFRTETAANGWFVENYAGTDTLRTGVHVDHNKDDALTVTTGWDGFADRLDNHKLYCTATLPAGRYELAVESSNALPAGGSRLVVAAGTGLPDVQNLDAALASAPLGEGRLTFVLDKETAVSLGIVFQQQGRTCVTLDRIVLRRSVLQQP